MNTPQPSPHQPSSAVKPEERIPLLESFRKNEHDQFVDITVEPWKLAARLDIRVSVQDDHVDVNCIVNMSEPVTSFSLAVFEEEFPDGAPNFIQIVLNGNGTVRSINMEEEGAPHDAPMRKLYDASRDRRAAEEYANEIFEAIKTRGAIAE